MGRLSYICTVCSEHCTRKYSGKRHNQNLHNGAARIVRLIDYLAGRSSGQYTANNPFWFKSNNQLHNFGSATVSDTVGDTFQSRYNPQQAPSGLSQNLANPMYRSMPTMDYRRFGNGLSQDTIVKIEELKRLMDKYPQYNRNRDGILRWAIQSSINGDNVFLDDKLEQLRSLDFFNTSHH